MQAACFFVHAAHNHLFFRMEGHEGTFRVPIALDDAEEDERNAEQRFAPLMMQKEVRITDCHALTCQLPALGQ